MKTKKVRKIITKIPKYLARLIEFISPEYDNIVRFNPIFLLAFGYISFQKFLTIHSRKKRNAFLRVDLHFFENLHKISKKTLVKRK